MVQRSFPEIRANCRSVHAFFVAALLTFGSVVLPCTISRAGAAPVRDVASQSRAAARQLTRKPITPAYFTYVVRPGDTVASVAQRYHDVTWLLSRRNGGLGRFAPGQRIRVWIWPFDQAHVALVNVRTDRPRIYVVAPGDSIWRISNVLHTTMAAFLSATNMSTQSRIEPGMRLLIHHYTDHWRRMSVPDVPSSSIHTGLLLTDVANLVGVDAALLKAMVWKESRWRMVRGASGEIGMAQIMPRTASWIQNTMVGYALDPSVPVNNILLGSLLVRHYLDASGNNMAKALALYHSSNTLPSKRNLTYIRSILSYRMYFYHHPRAGF